MSQQFTRAGDLIGLLDAAICPDCEGPGYKTVRDEMIQCSWCRSREYIISKVQDECDHVFDHLVSGRCIPGYLRKSRICILCNKVEEKEIVRDKEQA